jgi:small nuclear ribonucleoprotein (snRNP)-like protein
MFGDSATAITILLILLAAGLAAFIRKRARDKCLRDFERNMVTLEAKSGKTVWGTLRVENTGLEFIYSEKYKDEQGHEEASYILYKYEYSDIQAVIRFHDDLSEPDKKEREKELKRTYHPGPWRREKRRILNVFRTIRDSVVEIINLLISQAKKATPAGKVLASQDKYVSQMQQEMVGAVGTSFEPLLERYIGRRVVLQMIKGDKVIEYSGVLKEYTADFVEVMDVDYAVTEDQPAGKADLVVPRNLGLIRHLGE